MPYKRPNSRFYRLKLKLPGYGNTGQISCRVTSKTIARRMEDLLRRIAEKGLTEESLTEKAGRHLWGTD